MTASWPGPDPAIHMYPLPPDVDARIKSGHDGLGERGAAAGRAADQPPTVRIRISDPSG